METGGDLELPLFLLLEDPFSEEAVAAVVLEAAVEFFLFIGCLVLVLRLDVSTISPLFPLVAAVVVEDKGGDDGKLFGVAAEGVDEAVLVEDVISPDAEVAE